MILRLWLSERYLLCSWGGHPHLFILQQSHSVCEELRAGAAPVCCLARTLLSVEESSVVPSMRQLLNGMSLKEAKSPLQKHLGDAGEYVIYQTEDCYSSRLTLSMPKSAAENQQQIGKDVEISSAETHPEPREHDKVQKTCMCV